MLPTLAWPLAGRSSPGLFLSSPFLFKIQLSFCVSSFSSIFHPPLPQANQPSLSFALGCCFPLSPFSEKKEGMREKRKVKKCISQQVFHLLSSLIIIRAIASLSITKKASSPYFFSVGVILSPLLSTASLLLRLILAVVFSGKVVAFKGLQRNFANVCGKFPARKKPSYLSGPTSSTERMRRGTTEQRKVMISREGEKGFPSFSSLPFPADDHPRYFLPPHKRVLRGRASLPFLPFSTFSFSSLFFGVEKSWRLMRSQTRGERGKREKTTKTVKKLSF